MNSVERLVVETGSAVTLPIRHGPVRLPTDNTNITHHSGGFLLSTCHQEPISGSQACVAPQTSGRWFSVQWFPWRMLLPLDLFSLSLDDVVGRYQSEARCTICTRLGRNTCIDMAHVFDH